MSRGAPQGRGHLSTGLGARDPRARRNAAAKLAADATQGGPLSYDETGKQRVLLSRAVQKIPAPTTRAEAKLNELLQLLTDDGVLRP